MRKQKSILIILLIFLAVIAQIDLYTYIDLKYKNKYSRVIEKLDITHRPLSDLQNELINQNIQSMISILEDESQKEVLEMVEELVYNKVHALNEERISHEKLSLFLKTMSRDRYYYNSKYPPHLTFQEIFSELIKMDEKISFSQKDDIVAIKLPDFMDQEDYWRFRQYDFSQVKGLIFDLRDNPGGSVWLTEKFLSKFIEIDKIILIQKANRNRHGILRLLTHEKRLNEEQDLIKKPVIIIIDRETASAAEMFAAVMRFYKKAILISPDERTFGKNLAQNVFHTASGYQLTITSSELSLPDHQSWPEGLKPDIQTQDPFPLAKAKEILNDERLYFQILNKN